MKLEIWTEHGPQNSKPIFDAFIKSLEDIGVEHDELKASAEYDPKLEEAINTVFDEDDSEDMGYGDEDE